MLLKKIGRVVRSIATGYGSNRQTFCLLSFVDINLNYAMHSRLGISMDGWMSCEVLIAMEMI